MKSFSNIVILILLTLPLTVAEEKAEFSELLLEINKENAMSIEMYNKLLANSDSLFTKSLLNIFFILSRVDGMIITDPEIENMVANTPVIISEQEI